MAVDTTIARAGMDTDVHDRINALAARHKAACEAMKRTHYRRDGLAPVDAVLPDMPAIPDLPPAYADIATLGDYERRLWSSDANTGPVHRDRLPVGVQRNATPAQVVAALRALEEYVIGTERMATEYRAEAEQAVAAYLAEQEGHVRTIADIVAAEREARLQRERDAAAANAARAAEEAAKEAAKAEAAAQRIAWIGQHGSARLKRLLFEGIEHDAVYRDERLGAERPGWRYDVQGLPGTASDPRNPPEAALDLLDEARKTAPDARLVYWTVDEDWDDYGDKVVDEKYGYTATAKFLGLNIVYRVADDGAPPVVTG